MRFLYAINVILLILIALAESMTGGNFWFPAISGAMGWLMALLEREDAFA